VSRKAHKVDRELTASMGYKDSRSYRTLHGQEFLFGKDKTARRHAIYRRCRGRCFACGKWTPFEGGEWEHRIPLGDGGDDSLANGRWSCKSGCNQRRHQREVQFGFAH
jgi:hypothetical protein